MNRNVSLIVGTVALIAFAGSASLCSHDSDGALPGGSVAAPQMRTDVARPRVQPVAPPPSLPQTAQAEVLGGLDAPLPTPLSLTHNEALAQISERSGLSVEEIRRKIDWLRPTWFNEPLTPLVPWESIAHQAADYFVTTIVGGNDAATAERFEYEVLGTTYSDLIDEAVDEETPLEHVARLDMLLEEARLVFDAYNAEAAGAMAHKIESGRFDRWPYLSLRESAEHTSLPHPVQLSVSGGLGGGWVVQLDIYEGEYPTFDVAAADWLATKEDIEQQVIEWRQGK